MQGQSLSFFGRGHSFRFRQGFGKAVRRRSHDRRKGNTQRGAAEHFQCVLKREQRVYDFRPGVLIEVQDCWIAGVGATFCFMLAGDVNGGRETHAEGSCPR